MPSSAIVRIIYDSGDRLGLCTKRKCARPETPQQLRSEGILFGADVGLKLVSIILREFSTEASDRRERSAHPGVMSDPGLLPIGPELVKGTVGSVAGLVC
jgi:hypothetical protein